MTRYAATTDDGQRARAATREEIDRWAAEKCREGRDVEVWATRGVSGSQSVPVLAGRWES